LHKITLIAEKAKVMQKTIDSINITLEILKIYNDFLWANRRYGDNKKIHEQVSYDIKECIGGIILQKKCSAPSNLMLMQEEE
jgi:hypothetical protein